MSTLGNIAPNLAEVSDDFRDFVSQPRQRPAGHVDPPVDEPVGSLRPGVSDPRNSFN